MLKPGMIITILLVPGLASALTVEGTEYPPKITIEGKTLNLVGAGVREKTVFKVDIYTMAVYVENRSCNHLKLVHSDQTKMIRMDFVRDIPGDKMMANMRGNFEKRTPKDASPALKKKIGDFLALFKDDVPDKTSVRVIYVPGKGTSIYYGGKQRGPTIEGHPFSKILWDIWFNRDTCCPNLIEDIRDTCRERR